MKTSEHTTNSDRASDALERLGDELSQLAQNIGNDTATRVSSDLQQFLAQAGHDLKRWTAMLAAGQLSEADFRWLVMSRRDLAVMESLKQIGLGQAALDRIRMRVIDVVINAALAAAV